jgi:hypothetical protein
MARRDRGSGMSGLTFKYRTGRELNTTIYRIQEPESPPPDWRAERDKAVAWVPGNPDLARRIVALLNADEEARA